MQRDPIEQVLESTLNGFQLRVEIVADLRYCGEWQEREQPTRQGSFHLIDEGECVVESAALAEPTSLRSGDLVIFPHGGGHVLRSSTHVPAEADPPGYTSCCRRVVSSTAAALSPAISPIHMPRAPMS